ncbi:hypothetical protein LCGC14_2613750 [marine sediment metagenome]|uniref:Uncharacterized protein n=1 Tax=marine sediment metagenome TaxID=412755 RepID=A0A0F9ASS4_9ZZZZ
MKRRTVISLARDLDDDQVEALKAVYSAMCALRVVNADGRLTRLGLADDRDALTSFGKAVAIFTSKDCAWCGGECRRPWMNRRGEVFCSRSHREESNAALKRLVARESGERTETCS